ncbi:MAG: ATP-grasp domain-containing protein [Geminicoccaceae bacterium]|nr:ATP-grasp domain-containing protein [Geminicoccaceae bacterium]
MQPASRNVLLIGNYRPTLSAVRSLGRAGHRLVMGCERIGAFAERSRHVAERWDHPELTDPDEFGPALLAFLESRPDIDALFPVSGLAIMRVCEVFERLPPRLAVAMPHPRLVELCDHKTKLLDVAESLGIPYPPYALVDDMPALKAAAVRLGTPLVVKAAFAERRLGGEKALILRDEAAFARALPDWPGIGTLLVQRYAEGPRHNLHFVAKDGRLLRCLDSISLRTQRPNGSGLTVESVCVRTPPHLRAWCARMIGRMGYTGIGCLQFLVDPKDGAAAFLEINPRMAAGYGIAQHGGLDMPRLALDLATGVPVAERPDDEDGYRIGDRYAWTEGDIAGLKLALKRGEVGPFAALAWAGRILKSAFRADAHASWRRDDPRPTLAILARSLGLAGRTPPAAE